jgi:hypothetical protein
MQVMPNFAMETSVRLCKPLCYLSESGAVILECSSEASQNKGEGSQPRCLVFLSPLLSLAFLANNDKESDERSTPLRCALSFFCQSSLDRQLNPVGSMQHSDRLPRSLCILVKGQYRSSRSRKARATNKTVLLLYYHPVGLGMYRR